VALVNGASFDAFAAVAIGGAWAFGAGGKGSRGGDGLRFPYHPYSGRHHRQVLHNGGGTTAERTSSLRAAPKLNFMSVSWQRRIWTCIGFGLGGNNRRQSH